MQRLFSFASAASASALFSASSSEGEHMTPSRPPAIRSTAYSLFSEMNLFFSGALAEVDAASVAMTRLTKRAPMKFFNGHLLITHLAFHWLKPRAGARRRPLGCCFFIQARADKG